MTDVRRKDSGRTEDGNGCETDGERTEMADVRRRDDGRETDL